MPCAPACVPVRCVCGACAVRVCVRFVVVVCRWCDAAAVGAREE